MGRYVATYPAEHGPVVFRFASAEDVAAWAAWCMRVGINRPVSIHRRGRGGWVRVDSD